MLPFYKVHGLANDFVVIDAATLADTHYDILAPQICARHTGIGADGLLVVDKAGDSQADFTLRIFNADGSEAEMSGNGIRCATAALYEMRRIDSPQVRIATLAGIKTLNLRSRSAKRWDLEVQMGRPSFASETIPMLLPTSLPQVVQYPLNVDNQIVNVTAVSTGNPHCSVFIEASEFDDIDWRTLGAQLERHNYFPNRTNVEFVKVLSREELAVRFWERGVGETSSSGTGACGASLAAMLNGFTERKVHVQTAAGELQVVWQADDTVILTGPAEIICHGHYYWR